MRLLPLAAVTGVALGNSLSRASESALEWVGLRDGGMGAASARKAVA